MRPVHRIGRRLFLTEVGRGALVIAAFGPVFVACGGDDSEDADAGETASTTTTAPSETTSPSAEGSPDATWRRVDFGFVSAYVVIRGSEAAVVDTGVAGSGDQIHEALTAGGADWAAVRHVLLTHHHPDHAGSVAEVLEAATRATAYAGEPDVPSIESPRPLEAVADGAEVFGLQVIGTPGHTPGHISVLDPASGYLVAGDALTAENGVLAGPSPQFTADMDLAAASVQKLATLQVSTVAPGHGDVVDDGASDALAALAADLR